MNDEITNIPKIRFKGYTEEWEQRKWYDTVNISTDMVDPKEGKYDDLPHIGPGNIESFTGRILNNVKTVREDNLISGKFHFNYGDIIYGKINPQLAKYAYVNFEGLTSADTYVLNSHNGIDQYFLFVILQTKDFYKYSVSVSMRTGMPKINRDELNQYNYLAPSNIDEQRKIGTFFKQLDDTIALHQRELDLLRKTKQTYLKKMFPKTGEDRPEIRFAGFTEPWEQRELGKHLVPYNEVTTENNQYPVFTSSRKGLFFQKDYYDGNQIASEDNTGYNIVPRGYFTYRHMSDDLIFKFNINDIADKGIVSTLYPVFSTTDDLDSKYLQYQLNEGQEFKRFAILQKQGGSRTYMYLSKLKNMIISLPKYDEQIKISTFFKQLDDTIALHQHDLNTLKEMKKSLLQQMFV